MDPDNPIVALCTDGMRAETEGRPDDARALFQRAWDTARDDYEACVAAHYLARHQPTPDDRMRWNAECLARAEKVGDDRVAAFYPSLHLNLARDHADRGDPARARAHYEQAAAHLDTLPPGPYTDWTRYAIVDGLRDPAGDPVRDLAERLCARRDLTALALLLPAYAAADRETLTTVLHLLHASPDIEEDERALIRAALPSG